MDLYPRRTAVRRLTEAGGAVLLLADREGEPPQAHLKDFRGIIHADGYAGFNELFAAGRIVEAGCWAHVRRKFFDVRAATGSPIAKEALYRIGQLYAVEKIVGSPPARRRQQRQR